MRKHAIVIAMLAIHGPSLCEFAEAGPILSRDELIERFDAGMAVQIESATRGPLDNDRGGIAVGPAGPAQ